MVDNKLITPETSFAVLHRLMISVVLFIGTPLSGCTQDAAELSSAKFKGIYEASAAAQLPDSTLLVVEDESAYALNLVTLDSAGRASENDKQDKRLVKSFKRELDDLEGITMGRNGEVYATTSFSRTKKGKRVPAREQLVRFSIQDNELIDSAAYIGFGDFLRDTDIFGRLRRENFGKKLDLDMNIEALSFDADKRQLLFGFRAPLIADKSMLVRLENPGEVLSNQARPILSNDISLLDLNGGGIRSLEYDKRLEAYLIASEVQTRAGKMLSQLWLWSGKSADMPQALDIPAVQKMKNIEAITPLVIDGVDKILLLSDDGNRKKNKPAHYLILNYDQLGLDQ